MKNKWILLGLVTTLVVLAASAAMAALAASTTSVVTRPKSIHLFFIPTPPDQRRARATDYNAGKRPSEADSLKKHMYPQKQRLRKHAPQHRTCQTAQKGSPHARTTRSCLHGCGVICRGFLRVHAPCHAKIIPDRDGAADRSHKPRHGIS